MPKVHQNTFGGST